MAQQYFQGDQVTFIPSREGEPGGPMTVTQVKMSGGDDKWIIKATSDDVRLSDVQLIHNAIDNTFIGPGIFTRQGPGHYPPLISTDEGNQLSYGTDGLALLPPP